MRRKLYLASVFSAVLPFAAHADVTLHLNQDIELLAFNGQEYQSKMFDNDNHVVLSDGTQQLAFRSIASFEKGKEVSFQKSDVIVVKFDASDEDVYLDLPEFKNKREAVAFNKNPNFQILDGEKNAIAFEQGKLIKSGFQLSRDYLAELQRYNETDQPASLQLVAVYEPKPKFEPHNSTVVVNETSVTNEVEYQLHYWYEKADAATKEKFKSFVNAE
ncbi:DUF2057 domain-containing protein [Enterovibrio sp. ZSDZ35]|uniref:UPF0319 protein LRP49_24830 n=1 Tax=Enterovibrio qingdaonensis TaxID=2899818 RepID=A0ABT5QUY3_9GAMM|nr:DUF2057 domain-containing protein [Enterovibrio sp. ZSDZ35]MDD1784409.1 DUF2057 domain-containing protein [Enterovibrio sp. ZSDZ35]